MSAEGQAAAPASGRSPLPGDIAECCRHWCFRVSALGLPPGERGSSPRRMEPEVWGGWQRGGVRDVVTPRPLLY